MNAVVEEKGLSTADLAAAAQTPVAPTVETPVGQQPTAETSNSTGNDEGLAPLFLADVAAEFRAHWDAVQIGFVDDPQQAVRKADELVAQVMKSLAETFSRERSKLEGQMDRADAASTEDLRVALRRYRSFFERLLAL